jgi:hypothetical protein
MAQLPIRPFTAKRAAAIWKVGEAEAVRTLDLLAGRALLLDFPHRDGTRYVLPPPMAGFFEFSMMRVRGDIDQKALSELFHGYLNVEEDFARALFATGSTQMGRAFVDEAAIPAHDALRWSRAGQRQVRRASPRLLLSAQGQPPGNGLRRAHGHLHDLWQHRGFRWRGMAQPGGARLPSAWICCSRRGTLVQLGGARKGELHL